MAELIKTETGAAGWKHYIYACEKCGCKTWRYTRSNKRIICGNCRKSEEREKQKQRQEAKYQEAYNEGYVDAIEDCISIVGGYLVDMPITHDNTIKALCKLKEKK